jgi:L-ascorbate metabolism protein UlaG (beta-lactamase superfamily)
MSSLTLTLICGPTALIEIDGFRLLTDPTFDAPRAYQLGHVKLEKLSGPALAEDAIGEIDAVLLSHDQHADNLDESGKHFLPKAKRVLTTEVGAKRLGGHAEGLTPWASVELSRNGHSLTVTATPARHGPAGIEPIAGDVIGLCWPQRTLVRSTSAATPSGMTGWRKWRGASRPVS